MSDQEKAGWGLIAIVILLIWWLTNHALGALHGTSVQTTMLTPGGDVIQQNQPTMTGCGGTDCNTGITDMGKAGLAQGGFGPNAWGGILSS